MAVLKDLIVHGPSRFISAVGFTDLTANKIEADTVKAENGYFTKLKAKTATMDSVVVNELLDVHGELHTKSWSNSNIATVDGNFHIVPTITAATATGTITYSSGTYSMDVTGAFATNTLTVGNSTSVVAWTPGSSLIVSGEVQINNEWLPLGTLKCDLGGSSNLATDATSKKIPLSNIKDSNGQVSGVLEIIREALNLSGTSSTLNFRNVKIAFYSRKNTKMYPIGILLTAQGTGSSKTFIDMYNGNNESSSIYGGLAMPVVRIGNLSGNSSVANNQPLPAVGGQIPTGWGIYTSNGYFSGTIAAEKGKIANFTINGNKLYSNNHSAYNTSVTGIYIGDDYISFGSGGVTYFNTSGTGKIGPWTLSTTYIRNGAITGATNTSVAGVYLGTDGLNISNGTAATTAYITKTAVNIGNKLTWNGTTLSVNGTVTASSGTIGGWTLSSGSLYKYADSTGATVDSSKAKYYVYIQSAAGSNGGNYAFALRSRTDAQVTANSPAIGSADVQFGVAWNGSMYARNADVVGKITANSGYIGGTSGWTIASQQLYNGTIGADNSLHLGTKNLGSNTSIAGRSGSDWRLTVGSKFGVTNTGVVYANGATITGAITATSLSLGTNVSIAAGKVTGLSTVATSGKYSDLSGTPNLTVYIAKDGTIGSTPASGANGFKVSSAGVLTASNAIIYGTIYATAGTIGGCSISSGVLKVKEANIDGKLTASVLNVSTLSALSASMGTLTSGTITYGTVGSNSSFYLSSTDKTATIAGASRTGLRLTVGSNFGVTNTGAFYASAGAIGNSVTIGGTAASTVLSNISTAQSTANTAKTNAATAQSTANTANTNATNAAKTATNYIANIDSNNGITIKAINGTVNTNATTGNYIKLNAEGLDIYQGGVSVAKYGAETRIGLENGFKTIISAGGIQLTDDTGDNNFTISPSPLSFTTKASTRVIVKSSGTSTLVANLSQYTLTFVLQRTTSAVVAQVTKTNSDVAIGSSFTLGTSTYKVTITRTAANTFSIKRSGSSTASLMLSVNWTTTSESMSTINFSGANSVLWSGAMYMTASQSATLSEPITAQLNGIVLAWSAYVGGAAQDYDWVYTFIPKNHIFMYEGRGVDCGAFCTASFAHIGAKYVYVSDELITGNDNNNKANSGSSINYDNNYWVLRYVFGV